MAQRRQSGLHTATAARHRRGDVDQRRAITAVGYLRRSTDRQEQSIGDQRQAVERYCAERGLTLLRCYVDDAISGTSTVGRHAFQQMIADAQRLGGAQFAAIVVYDVKRFGRIGNDEAGYFRHLLKQHGVEVFYASENFAGDGTDDLLRPVKQWQARQESKDLSKVTIRGLLSKSDTGHWMGGAPPFAYDLRYASQSEQFLFYLRYNADGTKEMFDAEWKVVRTLERGETVAVSRRDHCTLAPSDASRVETVKQIFLMYVDQGMGFKAIADRLNRDAVPTPRGPGWAEQYSGQWSLSTVRAILVNPAYCGDVVWNRRTDARFHRIQNGVAVERKDIQARRLERNEQSDWTIVRDAHPGIVSRRVWELAQMALEQKSASKEQRGVDQRLGIPAGQRAYRAVGDPTGPRSRFLLSKMVCCARCGSRYEGYTSRSGKTDAAGRRRKWYAYACGGYIRRGKSVCDLGEVQQEVLENAVIEAVVAFYARYRGDDGERPLGGALRDHLGMEDQEVSQTMSHVRSELERVEGTTRRLLDNITRGTRSAVERRLGELEAERARLEAKAESLDQLTLSKVEVRALVADTRSFLARLEPTLRDGTLGERQASIRRCVTGIVFDRGRDTALVTVWTIPTVAHLVATPPRDVIEIRVESPDPRALCRP